MPYRAAVITVSDRSAAGERADSSGPVAVAALREAGFDCDDATIVPDGADSVERRAPCLDRDRVRGSSSPRAAPVSGRETPLPRGPSAS